MLSQTLSVLTVALFAAINEVNIVDLSATLVLRLSVLTFALFAAINEVNIVDLSASCITGISADTRMMFIKHYAPNRCLCIKVAKSTMCN